ncbi:hypothetical protein AVR91_0204250 [Amycolatopsis keratiniphila subsp. keratiniphila]|uniref:Uncharacterized protein n=1 Tax=Amycolatopsis keratiniphila subsp. keratiniphila TaxID=227715 RepID=A0A1W2M218_9PSEU|nr:hypothetical protein AVR91_0204250 [Amycolatopsis keratiniphila subsp. keratiniphila]
MGLLLGLRGRRRGGLRRGLVRRWWRRWRGLSLGLLPLLELGSPLRVLLQLLPLVPQVRIYARRRR